MTDAKKMTDARGLNYDGISVYFPGSEEFDEYQPKIGEIVDGSYFVMMVFESYILKVSLCYNGEEGKIFGKPEPKNMSEIASVIGLVNSDLEDTRSLLEEIQQLIKDGIHQGILVINRRPISNFNNDSRFIIFDQSTNEVFQEVENIGGMKEKYLVDKIKPLLEFVGLVVKISRYLPYVYGDHKIEEVLRKAVSIYKQAHLLNEEKMPV